MQINSLGESPLESLPSRVLSVEFRTLLAWHHTYLISFSVLPLPLQPGASELQGYYGFCQIFYLMFSICMYGFHFVLEALQSFLDFLNGWKPSKSVQGYYHYCWAVRNLTVFSTHDLQFAPCGRLCVVKHIFYLHSPRLLSKEKMLSKQTNKHKWQDSIYTSGAFSCHRKNV